MTSQRDGRRTWNTRIAQDKNAEQAAYVRTSHLKSPDRDLLFFLDFCVMLAQEHAGGLRKEYEQEGRETEASLLKLKAKEQQIHMVICYLFV